MSVAIITNPLDAEAIRMHREGDIRQAILDVISLMLRFSFAREGHIVAKLQRRAAELCDFSHVENIV